jgi:hypothetical protein
MDFNLAISAHTEWKTRLRVYIGKHDNSLQPATVAVDDGCALGKWLVGEGATFKALPDYGALKSEHAKFHKCAAEVVTHVNAGDYKKAEALIGAGSSYMLASTQVVGLILKLKKAASL